MLQSLGYIVKRDGEYEVGTQFLGIGEKVQNQMAIYQVARPEGQKLAEETGKPASLLIEENRFGFLSV